MVSGSAMRDTHRRPTMQPRMDSVQARHEGELTSFSIWLIRNRMSGCARTKRRLIPCLRMTFVVVGTMS